MKKEISYIIPNMCKVTLWIDVDVEKAKEQFNKELNDALIEQKKYFNKLLDINFITKAPPLKVHDIEMKARNNFLKIMSINENIKNLNKSVE